MSQIMEQFCMDGWKYCIITSYSTGVLKLFLRRARWDSSAPLKGQNCFWRGAEYVREAHITNAKREVPPAGVLEALGL